MIMVRLSKNQCKHWWNTFILPFGFVLLLVIVVLLSYILIFRSTNRYETGGNFEDIQCGKAYNRAAKSRSADGSDTSSAVPNAEPPAALTWSKYQISRTASFSIPYLNFRVLIYERDKRAVGPAPDADTYYFAPALILDSSSANASYNFFEKRYAVTFSVIMYNNDYLDHLKKKIVEIMDKPVKTLRIMPVEEIRISSGNPEWDSEFEVDNSWRPYASQSDVVEFRIYCATGWKCQRIKEGIISNSNEFISDLEVYYTLESQRSAARRLTLTAEHIQTGKMFTELEQRFRGVGDVYLSGEDSKKLQQEVANNVMASEISDAEFVNGEQSPSLMQFIEQALMMQDATSSGFSEKQWESVYWRDENSRPDKITKEYQDAFDKQDKTTQEKMMDYFKQQKSEKNCGHYSAGLEGIASGSVSACTEKGSSSSSKDEMENFLRNINEGRKVTEMQGERFVPKELSLKRTNVANLKQTSSFGSVSIKISKVTGVMKTNINVVANFTNSVPVATALTEPMVVIHGNKKHPSDIREVFHVRANVTSVTYTKAVSSTICKTVFNSSLATLSNMRDAWLNGADWCIIGHIAEDKVLAYPATSCWRNGATDARTYKADICYKDIAEINSLMATEFGETYDLEQSGFNCYGIKPMSEGTKSYGGNELIILPFSPSKLGHFQHSLT